MWSEYTLKIWNLSWTGCPWSLRRVIRWTSLFLPSKKNEHYCPTPYSATARDVNKSSQLHFQGKNNHSNSAPPLTKGNISKDHRTSYLFLERLGLDLLGPSLATSLTYEHKGREESRNKGSTIAKFLDELTLCFLEDSVYTRNKQCTVTCKISHSIL